MRNKSYFHFRKIEGNALCASTFLRKQKTWKVAKASNLVSLSEHINSFSGKEQRWHSPVFILFRNRLSSTHFR